MVVGQNCRLFSGSPLTVFAMGIEDCFEGTTKDDLHILPNSAKLFDMWNENITGSDWGQPSMPQPKPLSDIVVPIPSTVTQKTGSHLAIFSL